MASKISAVSSLQVEVEKSRLKQAKLVAESQKRMYVKVNPDIYIINIPSTSGKSVTNLERHCILISCKQYLLKRNVALTLFNLE